MEREGSLLCSQDSVTGPYPETNEPSWHSPTIFISKHCGNLTAVHHSYSLPS
jgi:hypothetical protein